MLLSGFCGAVTCHDCLACSVPVSCASIVLLVGIHVHVVFVRVRYLEIPVGCHLLGTCCLDVLWHGAQQDAGAHACCLVSEAVDCLMLGFAQTFSLPSWFIIFFCSAVVLSLAAGCVGSYGVRERKIGFHGWWWVLSGIQMRLTRSGVGILTDTL